MMVGIDDHIQLLNWVLSWCASRIDPYQVGEVLNAVWTRPPPAAIFDPTQSRLGFLIYGRGIDVDHPMHYLRSQFKALISILRIN